MTGSVVRRVSGRSEGSESATHEMGSQGRLFDTSRKARGSTSSRASDARPGKEDHWRLGSRGTRAGRPRSNETERRKRAVEIEQLANPRLSISYRRRAIGEGGGDPILRPAGSPFGGRTQRTALYRGHP